MAEELKIELPPIVMMPEAQFIEKHLMPAYEEMKIAEDVLTLDKTQTKLLLDTAIDRVKYFGVGEEIKDEEYTPFFEQMPKALIDTEPILIADGKECVLRYAVSIKMIPTRLNTALTGYSDELTRSERQIYDFI